MNRSVHVKIFRIVRLKNSPDGNPRYDLYTSEGAYRTKNDAHAVYQISDSWVGRTVTLHLDNDQIARADA